MELWSNLNNFDLMQLLVDIGDKTEMEERKNKIVKIIDELGDTKIDVMIFHKKNKRQINLSPSSHDDVFSAS